MGNMEHLKFGKRPPEGVEFKDVIVCVTDRGEIAWAAPENADEYDNPDLDFVYGGILRGDEALKRDVVAALYSPETEIDIGRKLPFVFSETRYTRADIAAALVSVNPGRAFLDTKSLRALDAAYEASLDADDGAGEVVDG